MKYLGIDLGSTFIKSALLDLAANRVSQIRKLPAPRRAPADNPRIFQLPAQDYYLAVKHLIDAAALEHPDLYGVVLSTQMHGFVLGQTYVSWQDARCLDGDHGGKSYLETLRQRLPPSRMRNCGVYLKPSLGLCNLYAKLAQEGALGSEQELYTLGSYLIARLTGENTCHLTNAAPLGFADLTRGDWDLGLLQDIGVTHLRPPRIARCDFEPCGVYRVHGRRIQIYPDYGDQQISILGSGMQPGEGLINIATAAQACIFSDTFDPGPYELRPYFDHTYLKVVSNLPAGRNLDVLVRFVRHVVQCVCGSAPELDAVRTQLKRAACADCRGLRVDPTFYPTDDQFAGGAIQNIRPDNFTLECIFSAAYQEMAGAYWAALSRLCPRDCLRAIVCAGGVAWKDEALLSAIRAETGKACRLSRCPDEALSGLFQAAARCVGIAHPEKLELNIVK